MGGLSRYPFAPAVSAEGAPGRTSVLVVHYRGVADLVDCARSVLEQQDVELILVDNASPDRGVGQVPDDPRLRRLWLPRNVGFAAGVNAGLAAATGDVVLLLNPDAVLRRGCVSALRGTLRSADIAVPRVLLADDPTRLDSAGHGLYPDGLNWCRGRGELAAGRYEEAEDVVLFSGAAVALRRSALVALGGLDEGYWAYGEDADLSLRAARAGLRVRMAPDAELTHRVGGSFGRFPLRKAFLVERNRARVAMVHLPLDWLLAAPAWTLVRVVGLGALGLGGKGLASGFAPRERALLGPTMLAAWGAALLGAPGSLARRRALARSTEDRADYRRRLGGARVGLRTLLQRGRL